MLLLSVGLLAPRLACNEALQDEQHLDQTLLQDELALLAYADHQRALNKRFDDPKIYQQRKEKRANDRTMARGWREYQRKEELRQEGLGKFADLYRQPARPTYAQLGKQNNVFSLDVKSSTATKAFNNAGVSMDVAQAAHADGAIRLRDVLLASELVARKVVTHSHDYGALPGGVFGNIAPVGAVDESLDNNAYLGYMSDTELEFSSEYKRLDLGFNMAHYFYNRRFAVGVHIPVVQDKHLLKLNLDTNIENATRVFGSGSYLFAVWNRYDDAQDMLRDFFTAKGMGAIGGTSTGIGDVQLYAQARINPGLLDSALLSLRVVCPSAPQASTNNFWAPQRGNGGFFQTGMAFSGVSHYNKHVNLHFFVEGLYSLPALTNHHIPQTVTITQGMTSQDLGNRMALGYRLDPVLQAGAVQQNNLAGNMIMPAAPANALAAGQSLILMESPFRGLGDKVSKLKIAKALALDVRVGNLFEEVFIRRANLDVFYNFKINGRDRAYGLPEADYNLAAYEANSDKVEHRLGGEWRWQVNHAATVKLGAECVLWGKNVAQETQLSAGINYGF